MTHRLIKITTPDRFTDESVIDGYWHLLSKNYGDAQVLCSGLFLVNGMGYVEKEVKRGGITCHDCLRLVRAYKAVKL